MIWLLIAGAIFWFILRRAYYGRLWYVLGALVLPVSALGQPVSTQMARVNIGWFLGSGGISALQPFYSGGSPAGGEQNALIYLDRYQTAQGPVYCGAKDIRRVTGGTHEELVAVISAGVSGWDKVRLYVDGDLIYTAVRPPDPAADPDYGALPNSRLRYNREGGFADLGRLMIGENEIDPDEEEEEELEDIGREDWDDFGADLIGEANDQNLNERLALKVPTLTKSADPVAHVLAAGDALFGNADWRNLPGTGIDGYSELFQRLVQGVETAQTSFPFLFNAVRAFATVLLIWQTFFALLKCAYFGLGIQPGAVSPASPSSAYRDEVGND